MRILAIRGKNLASLADEFEILLNEGALQTAGLFAITGQTGAGKSTILDALCLALYDKIPRLPDGVGFAVGHKDEDENQRVKHNDVRSILRRGASHAFAEVDFIGKDKQSYRARWQVSKARGKASGKLQAQEISLSHINSGQRIGQTKTSTLDAISDLIDLNFDQFRRSVLLAQGDFAAFLKAKKDERSSLLERITGTELYSEISKAAFERAKLEKEALDRISGLMENQIPLDTSARQALEQQRDLFTVSVSELNKQIVDNQKIIDWYAELKKRLAAERIATAALTESSQAWNASEPLRARVKQVETAEPLRPLLSHYQTAQADFIDAEGKLKTAGECLVATEIKLNTATQQLTAQAGYLYAAETKQQQAQPVLKTIRALDTRFEIVQTTLNGFIADEKQLNAALIAAQQEQNALLKQQTEQNDLAGQLTDWLEKHQDLQALAADWTHWESELNRYSAGIKQREDEFKAAEQIKATVNKDQHRLNVLQIDMDAKKQVLDVQQVKLEDIKKQVGWDDESIPTSQLHTTREVLEAEGEHIKHALLLVTNSQELQQAIKQDLPLLLATQQTIETASSQLDRLNQQQALNNISLEEAKKALALIEATRHKDAEQLRQLLIKDQPCPVCGALEHPWQTHAVQLGNEYTHAQQQRVNELDSEKAALIKAITNAYQLIDQEKTKATELNNKILLAQEKTHTLNSEWNDLAWDNKPPVALNDEQLLPLLKQQHERVTVDIDHIKQQEKAALALQQQLKTAQLSYDTSKQQHDSLTSEYAALDKQHAQNKAELRAHLANIDRLEKQLNDIVEALSVPCEQLADWQNYLASPSSLSKKVQEFKQNKQQLETVSKNLATIEQQAQLAAQNFSQYQQQLTLKQAVIQHETKQQQSLTRERETLIANYDCGDDFNRPVTADIIEQNLNQQVSEAKAAQQQASNSVNTATTELATQKSQQQHWQTETTRRADVLQIALATINHALERLAINREQLSELLQQDENWLTEQKAYIEQLDKALQAATALLNVKTDDRKHHESQAVEITEDTATQTATQLQQQKQSLNEHKQECEFQLREDDKKIASSSHLKADLDKQRHRWEQWQSLNELIGSSTGAKFRVFAQSLTLEALLTHSNKHLADFAKRYALQRVPNSDLELQIIDRDMADDVRSVHSLSGGESFLVSLALALGLASLSSNKTQVESLFIDEGFGSLDPETLDIAIASLDTLQALGRKVGVISHVPILVERIGAKVVVEKQGGGKSTVTIVGGY
ncbi:MAG: exonuclease SbcC [Methylococcaceae bacterium NSP1-2]|nr:AAA family ATPase [Methylococcaceae bacterium]OYV21125.1 MAG: exonuclease SbcC [Methylococcaceae bacterium NSP1-2]